MERTLRCEFTYDSWVSKITVTSVTPVKPTDALCVVNDEKYMECKL